ncbi:hypothetical protein EMCRGX_G021590 [Ephydatia muelleri]
MWKQHAPQLDVRLVVLPIVHLWAKLLPHPQYQFLFQCNAPLQPNYVITAYTLHHRVPSLKSQSEMWAPPSTATVQFHTYNSSGILFYQINSVMTDFLGVVKLHGGLPWLIFDVGSGPAVVGSNSTRTFNDGLQYLLRHCGYDAYGGHHCRDCPKQIWHCNPLQHVSYSLLNAPDGFDAVSVQNVGSTYIVMSWDLPTHSNGILINFSLYCNGALAGVLPLTVISYNTTSLLPFTLYMYITLSVGQVLQSRPQALHSSWNVVLGVISAAASLPSHVHHEEDSPPGGPHDPESDTDDIVFLNKIINPDKSFGSSDPMCILLLQLSSLLVEHTAGILLAFYTLLFMLAFCYHKTHKGSPRMAFLDLGPLMFGPTDDVIRFFRTRNLLASSVQCTRCQKPMLECTQLTLQTWIMLLHVWARQNPVSDTAECAKVALNTAVDVYQWLREVCSTRLINDGPVMLGGNGVVVQIDESLFKHKPKYHRGRRADYEQWVFGMVDTSQTPSLGFMQMVDTRDAATLLPIIRAHTAPGTIIHSDEWAANRRISQDIPHLQHATVNHSVEFDQRCAHPEYRELLEQSEKEV